MKKLSVFVLSVTCLISFVANAQRDANRDAINDQVWKPFIAAFNAFDTDGFMKVHSKQVARVIQDNGTIMNFTQYEKSMRNGNDEAKRSGSHRTLELRFVQRIATAEKAYETGYYKSSSIRDGATQSFYGKFQVLLQKENGVWKIFMDADVHEEISEAIFMGAKSMDENP